MLPAMQPNNSIAPQGGQSVQGTLLFGDAAQVVDQSHNGKCLISRPTADRVWQLPSLAAVADGFTFTVKNFGGAGFDINVTSVGAETINDAAGPFPVTPGRSATFTASGPAGTWAVVSDQG